MLCNLYRDQNILNNQVTIQNKYYSAPDFRRVMIDDTAAINLQSKCRPVLWCLPRKVIMGLDYVAQIVNIDFGVARAGRCLANIHMEGVSGFARIDIFLSWQ